MLDFNLKCREQFFAVLRSDHHILLLLDVCQSANQHFEVLDDAPLLGFVVVVEEGEGFGMNGGSVKTIEWYQVDQLLQLLVSSPVVFVFLCLHASSAVYGCFTCNRVLHLLFSI